MNTGFHQITLGQSDSAPTGAPSIHWMPELVMMNSNLSRAQPACVGPSSQIDRPSELIYMIQIVQNIAQLSFNGLFD